MRRLSPLLILLFVLGGLGAVLLSVPPASAGTFSIVATDSTFIQENDPTDNLCAVATFSVAAGAGISASDRSLLHFDITSIPAGEMITSATLRTFKTLSVGDPWPRTYVTQRVTQSFVCSTVTWNNQPTVTTADQASTQVQEATGFYTWDVTEIVTGWHNGTFTNFGLRMVDLSTVATSLSVFVGEEQTGDARPFLIIETEVVDFRVYLDSSADPPTTWTISENDTSFVIRAVVDNIGSKLLNEVDIDLLNDTDSVATTGAVFNLQGGTEDSTLLTTTAPFIPVAGSYNWKIRGTYENETATTTDDTIRFWNFTLVVIVGEVSTIFKFIDAVLHRSSVSAGETTALDITVKNTGTANLFIRIFYDIPLQLIVSPDILTPDIIAPGVTRTYEFTVITSVAGTFTISARIRPVDVSDNALGTFVERRITLIVGGVPAVTTLSPSDVGISDVILEGKIDSLGGLESATVYFILWETDDTTCVGLGSCDSIVQIPQFGEVISFISNYRIYYSGLNTGVNYSYEFRLRTPSNTEFQGGVVRFATPTEFKDPLTALRNGFAVALGLDAIVMGGILGIGVILILTILMALITGSEKMAMVAAMGGTGLNLMLGWWPFWMFILIVVGMGIILFRLPQFQAETA